MKNHRIIIGILTILLSVGLSGCTQENTLSDSNKLVGPWRSTSAEYNAWVTEFFSNGTVISTDNMTTLNGTWELTNGKITIQMSDDEVPLTYTYSFSDNNRTLTLVSENTGESSVFKKQ